MLLWFLIVASKTGSYCSCYGVELRAKQRPSILKSLASLVSARQAMNDSNAMRKRLVKYVGPVTLLAFAFNIVKFFEATVEYRPLQGAPPSAAAAAAASGENDTLAVVSTGAEEAQIVTRSANNHSVDVHGST